MQTTLLHIPLCLFINSTSLSTALFLPFWPVSCHGIYALPSFVDISNTQRVAWPPLKTYLFVCYFMEQQIFRNVAIQMSQQGQWCFFFFNTSSKLNRCLFSSISLCLSGPWALREYGGDLCHPACEKTDDHHRSTRSAAGVSGKKASSGLSDTLLTLLLLSVCIQSSSFSKVNI